MTKVTEVSETSVLHFFNTFYFRLANSGSTIDFGIFIMLGFVELWDVNVTRFRRVSVEVVLERRRIYTLMTGNKSRKSAQVT